jgi:chromosome segregation ATPase
MLSMSDQPITTSIDDLVKYLNEHGETESSILASALNVSDGIINTWAEVLEKAQITKINYKMGKMFVSPMVVSKEGIEVAKKTVEMKKGVAETELMTQINMINQINSRLDEFKRYVSGAEGAFKSKAGEIKDAIDEIDKLDLRVDNVYKKLKDKKTYIDTLSVNIDKETQKLEDKAKAAEAISGRDADSRRIISDIRTKLDDSENRLKALRTSFDSTIEEERKGATELLTGIRSEAKVLRGMIAQQEKEVQDYTSFLENYKKESDAVKRQVERERNRILDDIAKSGDETRKIYGAAEKRVDEIKGTLITIKSQFGGYSDMSDRLNGIKNNIDEIEKKKDSLQKELDTLALQLKALATLDQTKVAEKTVLMERVEDSLSETGKKVDDLGDKTDDIKKGIDDMAGGV